MISTAHMVDDNSIIDNVCQLCQFRADTETVLEMHIVKFHAFKCTDCELIFQSSELLKVHESTAHKEPIFPCTLCQFTAYNESSLINHKHQFHQVNQEPFKCHDCDYKTYSVSEVEDHRRSEHRESVFIEQMVHQQSILAKEFVAFKDDLTQMLNRVIDDHNVIKQELFILRQNRP